MRLGVFVSLPCVCSPLHSCDAGSSLFRDGPGGTKGDHPTILLLSSALMFYIKEKILCWTMKFDAENTHCGKRSMICKVMLAGDVQNFVEITH